MWVDILTGTLLIVAILQGYRNGFIKALISFFSLFIGLIIAFQFAGFVANLLKEHTKIASHWLPFIAFLVVLIGVMIVLKMITGILQQTAEWLMLGWLNKLLGIVLYSFIYATLFSSILYFMQALGLLDLEKMKASITYEYLQEWWPYFMEKVGHFLPSVKKTMATFL
jgi:membrane protein required for colicin V production